MEHDHKLIHAFGALAELGQQITNKNSFQETIRTSLHLLSGALGIMRGAVARYSRYAHELNMLAVRGLGDDFPLSLVLWALGFGAPFGLTYRRGGVSLTSQSGAFGNSARNAGPM